MTSLCTFRYTCNDLLWLRPLIFPVLPGECVQHVVSLPRKVRRCLWFYKIQRRSNHALDEATKADLLFPVLHIPVVIGAKGPRGDHREAVVSPALLPSLFLTIVRTISNKFEEEAFLLSKWEPVFALFIQPCLDRPSCFPDSSLTLPTYKYIFSRDRLDGNGGCIFFYVRDCFPS